MEAISTFTLKLHKGEYKTWPLESELLVNGNGTGKSIPGYVLEAQYRSGSRHLFVTSWDCPFEESLEVVLTNEALELIDRKRIGAMYTTTWLERHEVIAENLLLLHCDNDFQVRVTVDVGLKLEQKPATDSSFGAYPTTEDAKAKNRVSAPWWKFW